MSSINYINKNDSDAIGINHKVAISNHSDYDKCFHNESYLNHVEESGIYSMIKHDILGHYESRHVHIKKVIFNDPATIVYWSDGSKTVVKKQDDDKDKEFDKEKGLAMAIAKKALGNQGNYFETIKKYVTKENEK